MCTQAWHNVCLRFSSDRVEAGILLRSHPAAEMMRSGAAPGRIVTERFRAKLGPVRMKTHENKNLTSRASVLIPSEPNRHQRMISGFPKDHAQTTSQSAMMIHPKIIAL
jgi:hypothetical protein